MWTEKENWNNRYSLRYAGGIYWLLDREQTGLPYREPIPMNAVGAEIWKQLAAGRTEEEIVAFLSAEYDVSQDLVRQDVVQFREQLAMQFGI